MKMTTHRGNCGTIGPQGIRGERGITGPIGPTGPRGPEGLTRALYENSVLVRGVDDPLKGLKFSLDNIPTSTVVQHKVPGDPTELVGTSTQQKLINKDLTDSSNTCRATQLASGTDGSVSLPDSLPQAGQILLTQADQKTTWEYPNRILHMTTFAFSVYKNILQTTSQTDITQFDQVKLNQPAGAFDSTTGAFSVIQDGLFTVNFTANASTDENASTFYVDLVKTSTDVDVLMSRQQVAIGHGVTWQSVVLIEICQLNAGDKLHLRVTLGTNTINDGVGTITLCHMNFNAICSVAS